jgi:Fe-S oxidoreductase
MQLSSRIHEFTENCENCGTCKRVCPFLDTYGTPGKIISENPEKIFLCSNCGACDIVCKENLRPSEILFELKGAVLRNGSLPTEVKNALASAQGYVVRGHRFPFSHYTSADTVFWPGCGLAGTSPEMVKKAVRLLSKHLNQQVGLVLDCCFDPLYQLGDVDSVEKASERIQAKLKKHGVTRVITGCTSCTKVLSSHLSEMKVEHIIEALPENLIDPSSPPFISPLAKGGNKGVQGNGERLFLHHPCPSFRLDGLRERAKLYVQMFNTVLLKEENNISNPPSSPLSKGGLSGSLPLIKEGRGRLLAEIQESVRPSCCGHGGGISSSSPDFSEKFTEKVIKVSKGNPVVTYCMGCKGKFLQGGQKAYHILEFMTGVKPIEKPVSSGKKWANRFFLALGQKFNLKKILVGLLVILLIVLTACIAYVAFGSSMGELILRGNLKVLVIGIIVASAAMLLPFVLKPLVRKVSSPKDN